MSNLRIAIAALSISAAALVALLSDESYTGQAVIPTKGDVPTVGFGSTFREDGSRVQMGDKITPPQALQRSLRHIQRDEAAIKSCVTAPLSQAEYDMMLDFSYQYGSKTLCASSVVREANAGQYAASCEGYLKYKFAAGYDCSTPGNTRCYGVWARSQARFVKCMAAQK